MSDEKPPDTDTSHTDTDGTDTSGTDTSASGAPTGLRADPGGGGRTVPVWAIAATVGVVLVALVALLASSGSGGDVDTSAQVVGSPAPELSGTTLDGTTFDLGEMRGEWVLVNFFATWCPPCVAEHPELVAFDSRNDDASVVSVAFDEPADVVGKFFADNGGDWPVVADAKGIPVDWGVVKLPESYLVSPDGVVVDKVEGGVEATGLERLIADHESAGGVSEPEG